MIPTRRFAVVVAITAPVWLLSTTPSGSAAAAGVAAVVLFLGVADALLIPAAAQLRVRRVLPTSIGLGDTAEGEYRIESAWPRRLELELNDALPAGIERRDAGASTVAPWRLGKVVVPRGGQAILRIKIAGRERGEHPLGRIVLRVRGPLGLMQRSLKYDAGAETIEVVPSIAGVRQYRLLAVQHRLREAGIRTVRRRGEGTTFANLREYVEGDDPRHLDWKASVRRGKLITREYAAEQGQTVVIAIDAGRMMTQLVGAIARFEYALASATVLADVATRSGDHASLIVFNDEVRAFVPPGKGALALRRIRAAMIPLAANLAEPDYAGAFRTLAARHRKRSLIVLFTDVVDPRASRVLIAHTARSAARHLVLVVALQNDELMAAAVPRQDRGHALFESAAAEELLLERNEALARMRQTGVSVIDVSPRVMTAAVVNRYLTIKARSAL